MDDIDPDNDQVDADDGNPVTNDVNTQSQTGITWDREHDWSQLKNTYGDTYLDMLSDRYQQLPTNFRINENYTVILRGPLKNNHKIAHDDVVRDALLDNGKSITDGRAVIGRIHLLLGQGGGGKSHTINVIINMLIREHSLTKDNYSLRTTTEKAATVIIGSMLYSFREGFSLPVGRTGNGYKELRGKILKDAQKKYKYLKLLVVDEFSILRQRELFYLSERLKQINCDLRPFGSVTVLLVGDPDQIPPVQGYSLWFKNAKNKDNVKFHHLFLLFNTVVEIEDNMRLDQNNRHTVELYKFLQ